MSTIYDEMLEKGVPPLPDGTHFDIGIGGLEDDLYIRVKTPKPGQSRISALLFGKSYVNLYSYRVRKDEITEETVLRAAAYASQASVEALASRDIIDKYVGRHP